MGAPQPEGGGRDRRHELHHPVVAPDRQVADADGDRKPGDREQDDLDTVGADLAEQPVADDHEDRHQHGDVEEALGQQSADHRALRRVRARGHQDHADGVAGARRQHVVAHVADARQRVRVDPLRRASFVLEQPLPALGADDGRERVERDRGQERSQLGAGRRQLGRLLARRPPEDAGERDQRDRDPDPRQARPGAPLRRRRGVGDRCGRPFRRGGRSGDRKRMAPQPAARAAVVG